MSTLAIVIIPASASSAFKAALYATIDERMAASHEQDDDLVLRGLGHSRTGEVAEVFGTGSWGSTGTTWWNPPHVRRVRRRARGDDWELMLDPPVNAVLPVSRSALVALWAAFGED